MLWLDTEDVVVLTQPMRQQGPENESFRGLLSRVSDGTATDEDFACLQARDIERVLTHETVHDWHDTPIITTRNSVKDALNVYATMSYAARNDREVHIYYADDYRCGERIDEGELQDYLHSLHTGKTKFMGLLPLAIGMRVQLLVNYDVSSGIVNGCEGVLKEVRYTTDKLGRRHATSCIILVPDSTCDGLPHLMEHEVVALRENTEFSIRNPATKKTFKVSRRQLPIVPAYAMTVFKAQGKSFTRVIADVESCRSLQAVYVMLSRVKSLDGLLIL